MTNTKRRKRQPSSKILATIKMIENAASTAIEICKTIEPILRIVMRRKLK
jgi:hypothetical protein